MENDRTIYQDSWKSFKTIINYNLGMADAIVSQSSIENVEFAIFFIKQTIKLYEDAIAKSKENLNENNEY